MQSRRVLIVEDNLIIAADMAEMVRNLGHLVLGPYFKLNDGLDHARKDQVDFALLDFDLGDGSDTTPIVEVLAARRIPFAFATGTGERRIKALFGGVRVLAKPVAQGDLRIVLA